MKLLLIFKMNEKTKYSEQGEEVEVEKCPNCRDELVVRMKDGAQVFECDNCKFVKKKDGRK
jgi:ribosomal protein L37AE/L43A